MNRKPLKIALVGYGRMGHMIEQILLERGHSVSIIIEADSPELFDDERLRSSDVAIEFTRPESAMDNCSRLIDKGIPTVSGTTGWGEGVERLRAQVAQEEGKAFFWTSNFSIGVNLFFQINRTMARLMHGYPDYSAHLEETHHIHKLDAPSGTAITTAEEILRERDDLNGWRLMEQEALEEAPTREKYLPIYAYRQGEVPGIHEVVYQSSIDRLSLRHEAFGREGFALGAVIAAEYTADHRGALSMQDLLKG